MSDNYKKYLKYKNKYLKLKSIYLKGGSLPVTFDNLIDDYTDSLDQKSDPEYILRKWTLDSNGRMSFNKIKVKMFLSEENIYNIGGWEEFDNITVANFYKNNNNDIIFKLYNIDSEQFDCLVINYPEDQNNMQDHDYKFNNKLDEILPDSNLRNNRLSLRNFIIYSIIRSNPETDHPLPNLEGGGKRYLKQDSGRDPLILTPSGLPNHKLNKFLLSPEINYLKKECKKNKKFSKLCDEQKISSVINLIYNYEQTNQNIKKELKSASKQLKLSEDFILFIFENHKLWKKKHFLDIKKNIQEF